MAGKTLNPLKVLTDLRHVWNTCRKCPLGLTAKTHVFGGGSAKARVVFVTESPSETDDRTGEAFTGDMGVLLNRFCETVKIDPGDVYKTFLVSCRSFEEMPNKYKKNCAPNSHQMSECRPRLREQLEALSNLKLIVALGGLPAMELLGHPPGEKPMAVGKLRGNFLSTYYGPKKPESSEDSWMDTRVPMLVSYSLNYVIRTPTMKRAVYADFMQVAAFLKDPDSFDIKDSSSLDADDRPNRYSALYPKIRRDRSGYGKLLPIQQDEYNEELSVK